MLASVFALLACWQAKGPYLGSPVAYRDQLISDLIAGFGGITREQLPRIDIDAWFDVQALQAIGNAATPKLIEGLRSGPDTRRRSCAQCLERLADPLAANALREALNSEKSPWVREALAPAYGACGGSGALPVLEKLADSSDWALRRSAVAGLGNTKSISAIPCLTKHMVCRQPPTMWTQETLAFTAGEALDKIGPASYFPLAAAFKSQDPDVQKVAAYGLIYLKDPRVDRFLAKAMAEGKWPTHMGLYSVIAESSKGSPMFGKELAETQLIVRSVTGKNARVEALTKLLAQLTEGRRTWSPEDGAALSLVIHALTRTSDRRCLKSFTQALTCLDKSRLGFSLNTFRLSGPYFPSDVEAELLAGMAPYRDRDLLEVFLKFAENSDLRSSGRGFVENDAACTAAIACANLGALGLRGLARLERAGRIAPPAYAGALRVVNDNRCKDLLTDAAISSDKFVAQAAVVGLGNVQAVKALRKLRQRPNTDMWASDQLLRLGDIDGLRYFRNHPYAGELGGMKGGLSINVERAGPMPKPLGAFSSLELKKALTYPSLKLTMLAGVTLAARNDPYGWAKLRDLAKIDEESRWKKLGIFYVSAGRGFQREATGYLSRRPTGPNRTALLQILKTDNLRTRFVAYEALLGKDAVEASNYYTPID